MQARVRVLWVLAPLAALALGLAWLGASIKSGRIAAARTAAAEAVAPATPWRTLPAETVLERIGFGSCLDQDKPQPVWSAVLAARPQLFLMIGDNVYGDVKSPDLAELKAAYRAQGAHPELAAARRSLAMLPVWDDHDYGRNDAGADFEHRAASERLFREFWQTPRGAHSGPGVSHARIYGPQGRRVQIIMLDTRSFRSELKLKPKGAPLFGRYAPDDDPEKTMLGAEQWAWLEAQLQRPAEVRLLVSSVQVHSDGHAREGWRNLPRERERLLRLIETTRAAGTVLLSGDRHMGALYERRLGNGQLVPEITSSSLNRSYGPAKDEVTPELTSGLYHVENFGLLEVDWSRRRVRLSLKGRGGEELHARELPLTELAPAG